MESRRDHIVTATIQCMKRIGAVNTSLTDICNEAEISRGALYKHFTSREEILCAVMTRIGDIASETFAFRSSKELRQMLEAHIRSLTSADMQAIGQIELHMLLESQSNAALREVRHEVIESIQQNFEKRLKDLARAGDLHEDVDVRVASAAIIAFLNGSFINAGAARQSPNLHLAALRLILGTVLPARVAVTSR